ncbi:unnamed protein product, partial [Musa textilis]
ANEIAAIIVRGCRALTSHLISGLSPSIKVFTSYRSDQSVT